MPKFSIKDLMISTAIVAVGMCVVAPIAKYDPPGRRSPLMVGTMMCLWTISCATVGAGFGFPFRAMRRGAIIGAILGWAILIAVVTLLP
jgi:predicted membrane protein